MMTINGNSGSTSIDTGGDVNSNNNTGCITPEKLRSHEGEHRGDHGESGQVIVTRTTKLYVFCAAINSCNLGYDIGVNTSAGPLIQTTLDLTNQQLELWYGSLNIWAMIGALFASFISDKFGRRKSFVFAAIGFIVGVILMATSQNYTMLMVGRVFVGLGIGFGLAIDPLYISEISPASHRGQLVTWSENAINVGLIFGFASGLIFSQVVDSKAWRWQLGMGAILPSIMIYLATFVMPETPRWLVSKERNEEAKQVLTKLYPHNYDISPVMVDIKDSIQREVIAEQAMGWGEILHPSKALRRMLLVGLMSAIVQQAVGIDAIQYYLVFILEDAGIDERETQSLVLIALGIVKLFFVIVASQLFDRVGRRPLFFISLIGMMISLILLALAFLFAGSDNYNDAFVVLSIAAYFSFFSVGIGPGAWLIPSEIFATCIRAKAMSLATFANRATATIMSSTFFTVEGALTEPGFFFLLAGICLLSFIFFYCYLPETKGRSLEDMTVYFAEITNDTSILDAEVKILKERQAAAAALGLNYDNYDTDTPGMCTVELTSSTKVASSSSSSLPPKVEEEEEGLDTILPSSTDSGELRDIS